MKRIFLQTVAGILAVCGASSAALLIDDFSVDQGPLALSTGSANTGVSSLSILGGARNLALTITNENSPNQARVRVANGTLDYSNDVTVASTLTVLWDGGTDATLTQAGFAPVDFTQGGTNNSIRISTLGDFALNSTVTLWSGTGNSATWNYVLPSSPSLINVFLAFSTPSSTTGVFNINGVTSARLIVNGIANADRSIDFISADRPVGPNEVPEPMSLALVGVGLIGFVSFARKSRQTKS